MTGTTGATRTTGIAATEIVTAHRSLLRTAAGLPSAPGPSPLLPFVLAHPHLEATLADRFPGIESVVHLAKRVDLHRPLGRLGPLDSLAPVTRVVEVRSAPGGVRVATTTRLSDGDGAAAVTLTAHVLLGGVTTPPESSLITDASAADPVAAPVASAVPRAATGPRSTTLRPPVDLAREYAEIAGDHNPIHLDAAAAASAGFPAPVLHGMAVLGLVTELLVDHAAAGDLDAVGIYS